MRAIEMAAVLLALVGAYLIINWGRQTEEARDRREAELRAIIEQVCVLGGGRMIDTPSGQGCQIRPKAPDQ